MPKDRDKTLNPATAQLKADKNRALKKGKAAVAAQRQQRLAHRNPARLQQQIDSLRESGHARDQKQVQELEQELARVKKARETLGVDANRGQERNAQDGRGRDGGDARGGGVLGKRPRGDYGGRGERGRGDWRGKGKSEDSSGEETDESVRRIPMPKDTPPPPPRRERRNQQRQDGKEEPPKSQAAQTVYESAPAVRDLQKEAVKGLVPAAVRRRAEVTKGKSEEDTRDEVPAKVDAANANSAPDKEAMDVDDELARFEAEVASLKQEEQRQALGLNYSDSDESAGEVEEKTEPGHMEMEEVEDEEA